MSQILQEVAFRVVDLVLSSKAFPLDVLIKRHDHSGSVEIPCVKRTLGGSAASFYVRALPASRYAVADRSTRYLVSARG